RRSATTVTAARRLSTSRHRPARASWPTSARPGSTRRGRPSPWGCARCWCGSAWCSAGTAGGCHPRCPPFPSGAAAASGPGGRGGACGRLMWWTHLDAVVGLLVHALQPAEVQGVLRGVAPEPVPNATLTRELGRVLRRPAVFPVPAAMLRLALGEMSWLLLA